MGNNSSFGVNCSVSSSLVACRMALQAVSICLLSILSLSTKVAWVCCQKVLQVVKHFNRITEKHSARHVNEPSVFL